MFYHISHFSIWTQPYGGITFMFCMPSGISGFRSGQTMFYVPQWSIQAEELKTKLLRTLESKQV